MAKDYTVFWSNLILNNKIDQRVIPSNSLNNEFIQFYIENIPFLHYEIFIHPVSFIIGVHAAHELIFSIFRDFFKHYSLLNGFYFLQGKYMIAMEREVKIHSLISEFNHLISSTYDSLKALYVNALKPQISVFENIYQSGKWGYGSGPGSEAGYLKPYITFLTNFIAAHNIKTIIDCGCGDWQYMRYVDLNKAVYRGFDVSPTIIALDSYNYSSPAISFSLYSGDFLELPPGDILICKEVLQHLPEKSVEKFISILKNYKYALISNVAHKIDEKNNIGTRVGGYNDMDITLPPFSLKGELVLELPKPDPKVLRFYLIDCNKLPSAVITE